MAPLFKNRSDAGQQLAMSLMRFAKDNPVVLGMARGGMILAAEIAKALDAQLDVLVVRKIGAPSNPEYGVGAVAPMGVPVFDHEALGSLHLDEEDLRPIVASELREVERRLRTYRACLEPLDLANRLVILADDGLATGITAVAAARYAKKLGASYLVFAAPVSSLQGARLVEREVEELVCLQTPAAFFAVGAWYDDFSQVEDEAIIEIMEMAKRREYLA